MCNKAMMVCKKGMRGRQVALKSRGRRKSYAVTFAEPPIIAVVTVLYRIAK